MNLPGVRIKMIFLLFIMSCDMYFASDVIDTARTDDFELAERYYSDSDGDYYLEDDIDSLSKSSLNNYTNNTYDRHSDVPLLKTLAVKETATSTPTTANTDTESQYSTARSHMNEKYDDARKEIDTNTNYTMNKKNTMNKKIGCCIIN